VTAAAMGWLFGLRLRNEGIHPTEAEVFIQQQAQFCAETSLGSHGADQFTVCAKHVYQWGEWIPGAPEFSTVCMAHHFEIEPGVWRWTPESAAIRAYNVRRCVLLAGQSYLGHQLTLDL